jgi:predicted nucleotidyltransferase
LSKYQELQLKVMKKQEIIKIVREFLSQTSQLGIPIRAAYMFGSHANGNAQKDSDIDVAMISEAFEGNRLYDCEKLYPIILVTDCRIEPYPFRPEDFVDEDPFVQEIKKTGLRIV